MKLYAVHKSKSVTASPGINFYIAARTVNMYTIYSFYSKLKHIYMDPDNVRFLKAIQNLKNMPFFVASHDKHGHTQVLIVY